MFITRRAISATRNLAQNLAIYVSYNFTRVSAARVAALRFDSSSATRVKALHLDFSFT